MLRKWFARHRNRTNFALHMVGIPATVAAAGLLAMRMYAWAAAAFIGGYALQFIGHVIEGNRSGEELLFRRIVGRKHGPGGPAAGREDNQAGGSNNG